jgi:hypothetical protein
MAQTVILTFKKIITGNKSWCFGYNAVMKQQSSAVLGENLPWPREI